MAGRSVSIKITRSFNMKYFYFFCLFIVATNYNCLAQPETGKPGSFGNYFYYESYNVLSDSPNVKEGPYELWYQGSKIISGQYHNNKKNSLWKHNSLDNKIYFQGSYLEGKKNGAWKYFLNQKPLSIVYFKNDLEDSLWRSFYENGQLHCLMTFDNGVKNGIYELYYGNGNLCERIMYKDGLPEKIESYYENKNVRNVLQYQNNKLYNVLEMNDSAGKTLNYGSFHNGNGYLRTYFSNGDCWFEGYLKNGEPDSSATYYLSKNNPFLKIIREKGKKANLLKFYTKNGEGAIIDLNKTSFVSEFKLPPLITFDDSSMFKTNLPEFQGGKKELTQFIKTHSKYKSGRSEMKILCKIGFDGKLTDPIILNPESKNINENAINIVNTMPPWIPGFENGIPIEYNYTLHMEF